MATSASKRGIRDVEIGAIVVPLSVVRQQAGFDLPAGAGREIAKFGGQLHAPRGQYARRQHEVVIRCQIEVVRHLELIAVGAGVPEAGE